MKRNRCGTNQVPTFYIWIVTRESTSSNSYSQMIWLLLLLHGGIISRQVHYLNLNFKKRKEISCFVTHTLFLQEIFGVCIRSFNQNFNKSTMKFFQKKNFKTIVLFNYVGNLYHLVEFCKTLSIFQHYDKDKLKSCTMITINMMARNGEIV